MSALFTLLIGDALERLRELPDESVQTCVTSPPYWGLRDYGVEGQIGLESTSAEFLARLTAVFREVRRVLRPDGTAWVNMGDTYASSGWGGGVGENSTINGTAQLAARAAREKLKNRVVGVKAKDKLGIPWRVAFALQGVRAAKTKVAALGTGPVNIARLKALEAIEHELEKVLPELRRELHQAMRNAA
jgi:hypothetical protein